MITLEDAERLREGFLMISFDEFCEVLAETIGAEKDYSRDCWVDFQDAPLHYVCSRNPRSQGRALIALAQRKTQPDHVLLRTLQSLKQLAQKPWRKLRQMRDMRERAPVL